LINFKYTLKTSVIGAVAGFFNGFFGSGGGTIVVPAMEKFLGIAAHKAHATAVAVILPMSVVSAAVYLLFKSKGTDINWEAIVFVSAGGMAGGFAGAKLLPKTPVSVLHKIFGIFMAAAGVRMLF